MRSRITAAAVAAMLTAIIATGCTGQEEPEDDATSTAGGKTDATSDASTDEPELDFSGTGDDETATEPLSGSYEIRWEISGNRTPAGDEAGFSVLMRCDPGPSFTSIVSESEVKADSGAKEISGLDNAECFLEVQAQQTGTWTVEFFGK